MLTDIDLLTASPSEILRELALLEPGPLMMSLLLTVDARALEPADALTYLELHEQVNSWWASMAVAPMVAVDEYVLLSDVDDEVRTVTIADARREEVAAALRLAPATVQDRLDAARLLAGPLAPTWEALQHGEITPGHARIVVESAARLPGALTVRRRDPAADTDVHRVERDAFERACSSLQSRVLPVARRGSLSSTRAPRDGSS
jgi:hypothetical protein